MINLFRKLLFWLLRTKVANTKDIRPDIKIANGFKIGELYKCANTIVLCVGPSLANPKLNFAGIVVMSDYSTYGNDLFQGLYYDNFNANVWERYEGAVLLSSRSAKRADIIKWLKSTPGIFDENGKFITSQKVTL